MKCSLVTVTYNSSNYIKDLINTASKNKKYISEIIIVDNNSKDISKLTKIINNIKTDISIKTILLDKNHGFAYGCNTGYKFAKSDQILFINPDVKLTDDSIGKLLKHHNEKKADITGGLVIDFNDNISKTVYRNPNLMIILLEFTNLGKVLGIRHIGNKMFYRDIEHITKDEIVFGLSGAYMLVKKSAFEELNGFDENFFMYLEDVDLCIRANHKKMKLLFCPHSKIYHYWGGSSDNRLKTNLSAWFASRQYFIKKHFRKLYFALKLILKIEESILSLTGRSIE